MEFRKQKLDRSAVSDLRKCAIVTVKPYALMISPIYVFLRKNAKFITLKAPLDFFTEEEIERVKSFDLFFLPEFVGTALPFRDAGRKVKMLLNWSPPESVTPIPPAPYEISDAVLRMMAPLWGAELSLESFFVAVFVNELCTLLPREEMLKAREENLAHFEQALLLSAWVVFLSLHLGITDLNYLSALRLRAFRKALNPSEAEGLRQIDDFLTAGEIFRLLKSEFSEARKNPAFGIRFFEIRSERVAQKIFSRMRRIKTQELGTSEAGVPTIYGKKGFADG